TVRMPASSIAPPLTNDGILLAQDGYSIIADYADQDCGADGVAGCQGNAQEIIHKTSQATFDCTPNIDFLAVDQPGRNSPFLLAGGCDTDKYLDNGEVFTYLIEFGNLDPTLTLDDITVTLRAVVPDSDNATDPGRLNNAPSPYVTVS